MSLFLIISALPPVTVTLPPLKLVWSEVFSGSVKFHTFTLIRPVTEPRSLDTVQLPAYSPALVPRGTNVSTQKTALLPAARLVGAATKEAPDTGGSPVAGSMNGTRGSGNVFWFVIGRLGGPFQVGLCCWTVMYCSRYTIKSVLGIDGQPRPLRFETEKLMLASPPAGA